MSRIVINTQNPMSTSLFMVLSELFPMRIFSPCLENSFCPVPTHLFHLARRMALIPWPVLLWYRHKPSLRWGLLLRDSFPTNLKSNPKRFWSVLKAKSKHKNVPETITMATSDNSSSILPRYALLIRERQPLKGRMVSYQTQTRSWLMWLSQYLKLN